MAVFITIHVVFSIDLSFMQLSALQTHQAGFTFFPAQGVRRVRE